MQRADMRVKILAPALLAGSLLACAVMMPRDAAAHDYLVTGAKPDLLFVIDPVKAQVVSEFHIPGANDYVSIIVPSSDGTIAYVLINKAESIAGIDLRTGREVFRADLSSPGERVQCMFAFVVTPDGKELIAYEYSTRLGIDSYTVLQPKFVVFSTAGGLHARPLRQFPAPRRIEMLLAKQDGRSFYALGFNLYEYDLGTGRLIGKRGILNWNRPHHSSPDMLAFWPVTEPTGIFASPLYSTLSGPGTLRGGIPETSLMLLDLRTGQLQYHDFERTSAPIFSAVLSPDRHWAFGAYTALTRIDTRRWDVAGRINLAHTYYSVNISSDGKEVYVGGAMCDIAIYDSGTLQKKGDVRLPGCGDQALATLRVVERQ
jgi:quinohemoprotein amine dehydrogenase beta subunit